VWAAAGAGFAAVVVVVAVVALTGSSSAAASGSAAGGQGIITISSRAVAVDKAVVLGAVNAMRTAVASPPAALQFSPCTAAAAAAYAAAVIAAPQLNAPASVAVPTVCAAEKITQLRFGWVQGTDPTGAQMAKVLTVDPGPGGSPLLSHSSTAVGFDLVARRSPAGLTGYVLAWAAAQ